MIKQKNNFGTWKKIKSAPKDGTIILVAEPHPGGTEIPWAVFAARWIECPQMKGDRDDVYPGWYASYIAVYSGGGIDNDSWTCKPIVDIDATHWMPMPNPPDEKRKN